MALRAGYYGIKKKILEKVNALPGIKTIGTGLSLSSAGVLSTDGSGVVDYSTTEQDTGIKWIDNKPIYRITISATTPDTVDTTGNIADLPANWDKILFFDGVVNRDDTFFYGLNSSVSEYGITCWIRGNESKVGMTVANIALTSKPVYITLYYTKKL